MMKKTLILAYQDKDFEIFVVDADGSNLRQLTDNSAFDGRPSWGITRR